MPQSAKNRSPKQISLFAALLVALCLSLLAKAFEKGWQLPGIIFCVSFLLSYFVYYSFLKTFVANRFKLIYKFIYDTKAGKKEQFFHDEILPQKSIDEVEREVAQWAERKSSEIETLKVNEQFRKEFLNNLTHELRTPIFTVQGYVHTLLDGAIDDENVNRKFLSNAGKGLDRLVNLANDLAQIAELESGNNPLNKINFDLRDLTQDVYEELAQKAEEKGIKLQFKKENQDAVLVFADREKIHQALVNLVENGIKYGKENGKIITGFWDMDSQTAYIEISDNGIGIEAQYLNRIFERFYRTDKSRNSKIAGTGLGLAIVKHIVEAHQQIVNVRSKVGVGSSFGFSLQKARN